MGDVFCVLVTIAACVFGFFWVIGKMFGPTEQAKRDAAEAAAGRRSEPTPTDVDRFLAEINRRRREAEKQGTAPAARPAPPSQPRRERRAPVVRQMPETVAQQFPAVEAVVLAEPVVLDPLLPTPVAARPKVRPASPIIGDVLPLLRSPRGLGAAFVLQEILGPPRCRRGR